MRNTGPISLCAPCRLDIPLQQTHPSLSWILALTLSMVSEDSTSRVIVFPVRVLTKICIFGEVSDGAGGRARQRTYCQCR